MKIIFHFGAHKTASTHLQYNLALNRAYLNQQGVAYFRFQEVEGLQKKADYLAANSNKNPSDLDDCIQEIRRIIQGQINGYEKAIISYEGCLGYHNHLNYSNIYPYADKIIPIYKKILKDHTVLPVYAIRDYNDFMNSTYRQELAHGIMKERINTYFKNKKISPRRWTEIIEMLKKEFSGDIKVFTFEDYKINGREICVGLLQLVSKKIEDGHIKWEFNKKNDSVSQNQLKFNYTLNRIFEYIPNFRYKKALYYRSIKHIFPLFNNQFGEKLLNNYQKQNLPTLIPIKEFTKEKQYLDENYGVLK